MVPLDGLIPATLTQVPDSSLTAQLTTSSESGSHNGAVLRKAAGEFEAILLGTLWKSMKETFSNQDDEDFDPTLQSFDELGIQGMAGAVGKAGGLGIKNLILKHLEAMPSVASGAAPPAL
jgi:Rod binding domain-containing protein